MVDPVEIILAILGGTIGVVLLLLFWLLRSHVKLKKEFQTLKDFVNRNNKDISGLCSAAVTIDTRLNERDALLHDIQQKLTQLTTVESSPQPYHSVIQKVRSGADINELMQNCGLSRDEAALLIRLHGKRDS